MRDVLELGDLVVGEVQDAQLRVVLEPGQAGDGVVRDVEFLEVPQVG